MLLQFLRVFERVWKRTWQVGCAPFQFRPARLRFAHQLVDPFAPCVVSGAISTRSTPQWIPIICVHVWLKPWTRSNRATPRATLVLENASIENSNRRASCGQFCLGIFRITSAAPHRQTGQSSRRHSPQYNRWHASGAGQGHNILASRTALRKDVQTEQPHITHPYHRR